MLARHNVPAKIVVALVLATAMGTVAVGAADAQVPSESDLSEPVSVVVQIDFFENGTTVWSVRYKYRLETGRESAGFETFRNDLRSDRSAYLEKVRGGVRPAVAAAENRTGREMSLGNVSVSTYHQTIPQETGIVNNRFVWHGFAAANETGLRVGDAIRGFTLGPRMTLVVTWPEGYEPARLEPDPSSTDGTEATWEDPDFAIDEPRFAFRRTGTAPSAPIVEAAVLAVMVGLGAVVYVRRSNRRRLGDLPGRDLLDGETGVGSGAVPDGSATEAGDDAREESDAESEDDAESRPDGEDGADDAGEPGASEASPPEPLSNEERVIWVLEAHDGRVKQQTLAEECDWSDSKTSRVVRRLHEDDRIDLFRLGRENVVSLPEVDHDEP